LDFALGTELFGSDNVLVLPLFGKEHARGFAPAARFKFPVIGAVFDPLMLSDGRGCCLFINCGVQKKSQELFAIGLML
jgi:hypothetical protein